VMVAGASAGLPYLIQSLNAWCSSDSSSNSNSRWMGNYRSPSRDHAEGASGTHPPQRCAPGHEDEKACLCSGRRDGS
jgi:hypothetical protein